MRATVHQDGTVRVRSEERNGPRMRRADHAHVSYLVDEVGITMDVYDSAGTQREPLVELVLDVQALRAVLDCYDRTHETEVVAEFGDA